MLAQEFSETVRIASFKELFDLFQQDFLFVGHRLPESIFLSLTLLLFGVKQQNYRTCRLKKKNLLYLKATLL